jgi:hypothetical protein
LSFIQYQVSVKQEQKMKQSDYDHLKEIDQQIQIIKKAALRLKKISGGVQAIDCNAGRILASAKMLEINFSDVSGVMGRFK